MPEEIVFDTSSLEKLDSNRVVVSERVSGELDNRGTKKGVVDGVEKAEASLACVNDNIEDDIKKLSKRELGSFQRNKVLKELRKALDQRSEEGKNEMLRRAWSELSSNADVKSWQGEKAGAETDCSVLSLAREKGGLVSEDKTILSQCREEDDLQCLSFED